MSIGQLGNGNGRWSLWLSVGDLGDSGSSLWLAITALSNGRGRGEGRSAGDGRGSTARNNVKSNRLTLWCPVLAVQVVEVSAQALIENSCVTKGNRRVAADGETSSKDGTGLGWLVKLELEVVGDVSSALLGVEEDTILEGENQSSFATAIGTLNSGQYCSRVAKASNEPSRDHAC